MIIKCRKRLHLALKKTYDAVPEPRIVIAVRACAVSGGPYIDHKQANNGADAVVPTGGLCKIACDYENRKELLRGGAFKRSLWVPGRM